MFKKLIHYNLINKCKKGNTEAQFEVYKLYYKAMYNTCLRIVKETTEAEDIMQESFLTAFKSLDSWAQEVEFGAWLKKIVINKSLDYLKKRKLELTELKYENSQIIEEPTDNENTEQRKIEKVKQAIELLPEKDRNLINLYLFEGYDHFEISEILNIKATTVRSQYTRAKEKLLSVLNEPEFNVELV